VSVIDSDLAVAWPELDRRFLRPDRRAAPPPFPLLVIAEKWRPWIEGHARASTCLDYAAMALLASVSAVCGSRFVVDVTAHWREPLVLWQALVGGPSTGKTQALAAARRLLGAVKAPPDTLSAEAMKPRRGEPELTPWLAHRGVSSWSDDLDEGLTELSRDRKERLCLLGAWTAEPTHTDDEWLDVGRPGQRFPESILGTFRADRLAETLAGIDDALLSRFLYGWPEPRLEARLDGPGGGSHDDARPLLQRLVDLPGSIEEPAALTLEASATGRLQALLPRLRGSMRDSDGLEAAWIGKAAGNIVRLAGLLCLMDWAAGGAGTPCTTVEAEHLDRAHALWRDYFRPQAQAVFGEAPSTPVERRVWRAARWLRRVRPPVVSREEVRREALGQTVNADAADTVIERLEQYGALRLLPIVKDSRRGPRKVRWQVNAGLWTN
jgi:hypothetical protein